MSKTYSAGIVTAYGAAKRAGYHGTYEDFCRQQAGYAESAAAVEVAKTAAQTAANTATTKAGEATTAATAAQTAKTQTEQAASQALTDIGTARTAAVNAVHTEGATQTANARSQAQAAAGSATTAGQHKDAAATSATNAASSARYAAASATSAAQSASNAQDVLDSIPADYSALSEDVDKLKADLGDESKRLLQLLNKGNEVIRWDLIYGYWDIQSGELTFHPANNKQFVASKYPIKVEAGDVIHLLDTVSSRFFAVYSATLNPAEWESLVATTNHDVTIPNAGYVLISVRNEPYSVAFTDADINTFFDERLLVVKSNFSTRETKLLANSDTLNGILANDNGYKQAYITNDEQTLTINVGLGIIVPCTQGDNLLISAELSTLLHPEFFTTSLDIREQNSSGTTKITNVTDLASPISYIVNMADTVRVIFVISLTKVSAQSVTTGYYETVNYRLAVKKIESSNELDSVCTEAGDTWEV